MTTYRTPSLGTASRNGSGRPAVVRAACLGGVVLDVRLGAGRGTVRGRTRPWIGEVQFGGLWPHHIGAEPAAGRRTP